MGAVKKLAAAIMAALFASAVLDDIAPHMESTIDALRMFAGVLFLAMATLAAHQ